MTFHNNFDQKCLAEMAQNGMEFSGPIITDGKIHRFSAGSMKSKKDEWYVSYRGYSCKGNEYMTCTYGSWNPARTVDDKYVYHSWSGDDIDAMERERLQEEYKAKKEDIVNGLRAVKDAAAVEARKMWERYEHITTTDKYCALKKIKPTGIRCGNNPQGYPSVVVPIRNIMGDIRSLQFISVGNDDVVYKTFLSGGEKKGNFFVMGVLKDGDPIFVAEGYATGCSIFEAMEAKYSVVVAFDCNNLSPVVASIRSFYPTSSIIICGDDDVGTPYNSGRTKAEEVADKYYATAVFPQFPSGKEKDSNGKFYTDFNDLAAVVGGGAVAEQVAQQMIPDWVKEFNKTHAVIHTTQTYILTEKFDPQSKQDTFALESVESFHTWYRPRKDPSGKKLLSKLWIEHTCRREYRGIVFDPVKKGHYECYYNLFQGFPVIPAHGDCSLFWTLIREGLCGGNEEKYLYIRRWLAHMFQRPWELPETAIAFRGQQGIGKGTIVQYLAQLVGKHYLELVQMDQVVGRFNGHLKDAILVYANEAVWGGSKSSAGALKALITDAKQAIELKGKDIITVQNYKRLILSSNEDWIVPRDTDDRRFFVIDCSTRYKEDHQFFEELRKQMLQGGLQALMHDLMHENISGWHPRAMPRISDGFDLKIRGMPSPIQWLYYALREGKTHLTADGSNHDWREDASFEKGKGQIYDHYTFYCDHRQEKPVHDGLFWKRIREVLGEIPERKPGKSTRIITLPSLASARKMFERYAKAEEDIWMI